MMYGYGWSWGWGLAVGMFILILVPGIVLAIVLAVRPWGHPPGADIDEGTSRSRARAILEERFARGEIDDEEFRCRSETLRR